jgi:amino acid transporter
MIARIKKYFIGNPKNPLEKGMFHKLSLIAFFAWIGLGADGLSSSCYGPESAFLALHGHVYLSVFVGMATAATVLLISASYSQIIELFPYGGGGYLVASKLLSPTLGMFSGCALIIDYVLTIAISVASGADAVFSFLPIHLQGAKLEFVIASVLLLMVLNIRGIKESVLPLVPLFLTFMLTHVFGILYAVFMHSGHFPALIETTGHETQKVISQVGWTGMIFVILRAFSLGAGSFTGIEAVSNGLPLLREPKVETGKRTMRYMAFSLAFTVSGLMIAYLLFNVEPNEGKTLNAVLFEKMTIDWNWGGREFLIVTLFSEGMLLFVAAQTGFLGGPRVLANMAVDRWFPTRFAHLSDRLVTQNGILIMGLAAICIILISGGSVQYLVVLYSINVFITFSFSQSGMVIHWWNVRASEKRWRRRLMINGIGLSITLFILFSVIVIKFKEGGWITLLVTGVLILLARMINRHYSRIQKLLRRLDGLVETSKISSPKKLRKPTLDPSAKTAVLLVSGFNGLGLHTLLTVIRLFGKEFRNFVFVEVGVIDAGNFKGASEVARLENKTNKDLAQYVDFMRRQGYYAEGLPYFGVDVIDEAEKAIPVIAGRFPQAVVFGGQLVFPNETSFTRLLHNETVFALQRKFYQQGIPFVILPIRM